MSWRGAAPLAIYRLDIIISPPSFETEDKYLAEVRSLPGCRAWGDTLQDALNSVESVAAAFISSCRDRGETLPSGITAVQDNDSGTPLQSDILISA
jgi:predicted RNase H-like HicB family nuclease